MIHTLAYTLLWGKPLIMYGGILTLLSFSLTAYIGFTNFHGKKPPIPFKYHPLMAGLSLTLGVIHGIMGLSIYFNF